MYFGTNNARLYVLKGEGMPQKYNPKNKNEKLKFNKKNITKKKTGKIRFIFGKDMSDAEIVDAVIRMAKEYGIPFKDNRKEHGIPIVDSRKKDRVKKLKP